MALLRQGRKADLPVVRDLSAVPVPSVLFDGEWDDRDATSEDVAAIASLVSKGGVYVISPSGTERPFCRERFNRILRPMGLELAEASVTDVSTKTASLVTGSRDSARLVEGATDVHIYSTACLVKGLDASTQILLRTPAGLPLLLRKSHGRGSIVIISAQYALQGQLDGPILLRHLLDWLLSLR